MNLSPLTIDIISHVLGWLLFLVLPLWLIFWLGRKAERCLARPKSLGSMVTRAIVALILAVYFLANLIFGMVWWPPRTFTQMKLRAVMAEQVKTLGGWEAVVKDCDQIVQRNDFHTYRWFSHPPAHSRFVGPPDPLPAGLAALKPRSVGVERYGTNQWAVAVFLHRPWPHKACGIRVICDVPTNAPALPRGTPVPSVSNRRKLADRVFEL